MSRESRITLRWPVVVIGIIAFVAVGAGGAYLWMRPSVGADIRVRDGANRPGSAPSSSVSPQSGMGANASAVASNGPVPDVVVSLSEDALKRAGIEVVTVTTGAGASAVRIPGTVEPNAYKQVVVTPLVAGRVTRVLAELGDQVRRGQTLAQVFSPELADAQTRYLSAKAELEAHERELDRTTKLVTIGAASQQELEHLHAEHAAKLSSVQSLRSRLVLLGMPASAIDGSAPGRAVDATTSIPAPIAGVVTERGANVGLNVDTATKLFTVVDLSTVWVVGALYEKDFSRVRVGSAAIVATNAYPGLKLAGRVSYIDPQVSPDTRTARVRVEVPNARQELRLGMYADIEIATTAGRQAVMIPRSAVQDVGDRQVVYVANPIESGKFAEREVRLGASSGDQVEVVSGVKLGDRIVSKGSFFVRAERERLGLGSAPGSSTAPAAGRSESAESSPAAAVQTTRITVGEQGYEPSRVTLRAGVPARLTFVRTTDKTCGIAVAFPSLGVRRELPLNHPVEIEFTPQKTGNVDFVCGMNMLRGTLVVRRAAKDGVDVEDSSRWQAD
jgi:cobalt-zinc-cadmium efflux system membrane fusion protein